MQYSELAVQSNGRGSLLSGWPLALWFSYFRVSTPEGHCRSGAGDLRDVDVCAAHLPALVRVGIGRGRGRQLRVCRAIVQVRGVASVPALDTDDVMASVLGLCHQRVFVTSAVLFAVLKHVENLMY
jgi:hypothetical protein